jgi:dolichol-phosphate mannosyltransferase
VKALVIIPTYNERDNIQKITREVLSVSEHTEVLVIDDNSPDGTGAVVDEMAKASHRVHAMHRPGKMGLGSAYIAGFRYAMSNSYDYVFEMDADFSHDPREIPNFRRRVKYDVVVGSRYVGGVRIPTGPSRSSCYRTAQACTPYDNRPELIDCTSGFKCFRQEVLESLEFRQRYTPTATRSR